MRVKNKQINIYIHGLKVRHTILLFPFKKLSGRSPEKQVQYLYSPENGGNMKKQRLIALRARIVHERMCYKRTRTTHARSSSQHSVRNVCPLALPFCRPQKVFLFSIHFKIPDRRAEIGNELDSRRNQWIDKKSARGETKC